uniref:non-specific serine/threonine protein kinase n=1 Tax=Cyprinodon variegatus TaxID=28743 RepID=A0A3Q2D132_CYPVA
MDSANYVARLNEYAQKERLLLKYEEVGSVGPDHIKTFSLKAVVNGKAYPEGVGKNKKEAKQNAAKNALQCLLEEPSVSRGSIEEAPPAHMQLKTNYMCWLNEYGQTNRVVIRAVESITPGQNTLTQGCRFVVGDKEYPVAYGRTKKDAREEAARLVHHEIMGGETLDTEDDRDSGTSSLHCEEVSSDISILMDTNFIGMVNSYCQKTRRSCVYKEEKRCGPPHNPVFFYKLLINDTEFPVCEGKSAKEAKQKAAQMAWSALKEQSDWDSKVLSSSICTFFFFYHAILNVLFIARIAAKFLNISEKSKEVKEEDSNHDSYFQCLIILITLSRFTADYDSIERLDKGSFGRVFKAKHKLEDKYYAVKIVHYREKTLQEVKVLSDLNHCNIVRYHSCWLEDGTYQWDTSTGSSSASQSSTDQPSKFLYIQMELCEIKTLRVWIDEKNIQNHKKSLRDFKRREESLNFALQMISGVEHIHSRKLIHRDLKPANIMFSRNGTVKIGDFGLVTSEIEDDAENQKERRGYKGTPSYMAPEQRNRKLYDRKVDIFALGLIFFELLWNIPTLNDKNEMWDKVRNQELPQGFIYHFSRESQMINSMLCSNPEERPEASKIKINLEEHIHSLAELKTKQRDSKTI